MADAAAGAAPPRAGFFSNTVKMAGGGLVGLLTGGIAVYSHAIFDQVVKPTKPVANFALAGTDGLKVTCDNHATGDSGWWDFGDGTELEAFDPAKPTITHTYPKPASYSIKLVVRNFLLEEDSRTVAADLTNPPNSLPPTVIGLKVEPIREQVPAMYRITGEIQNADEVVWMLGDKAEHTAAQSGSFEKLVAFEQPGQYPIGVTALSNAKKDPKVIVKTVNVTAPTAATYEASVFVVDPMNHIDRLTRPVQVVAPVRDKAGPTKGIDRVVVATPGRTIVDARPDPAHVPAVVKNLKVEVAADHHSARVTGDWTTGPDAVAKAAGGTDVAVPVVLTEERAVTAAPTRHRVSGVMDMKTGLIVIPLPRSMAGAAAAGRQIEVELGLTQPNAPRQTIARGPLDAAGNWSAPVTLNGKAFLARATVVNGAVQVSFADPAAGR